MTTLTQAGRAARVAPSRSRRLTVVLSSITVLLVVLVAGVFWKYEPVQLGSTYQVPAGSVSVEGSDSTVRVPYVDGHATRFGFTIQNTAAWGVTILGFVDDRGAHELVRPTGFEISNAGFTTGRPFKPIALAAGASLSLRVNMRFADCEFYSAASSYTLSSMRMRYRVIGLQRTLDVPIGFALQVVSPADALCPRARNV